MTSVTLPSELQAWAELEVAGGRAESLDTLIATALAARKAHLEYVRARLDEARRSEPLDGDAFLVEMGQLGHGGRRRRRMKRRFQVMAIARADIADIRRYIAEEAGSRTASAVVARLRERIVFIRDNPFACAPQPDFGTHMRIAVSQRWTIYYEVTDEFCRVMRVLDSARDAGRAFGVAEPPL